MTGGPLRQPGRALRAQRLHTPAQLAAVAARVGKPVYVVDAQAVDQARSVQGKNRRVRRFEHGRVLDPQARQAVDVEKAPPVDLVGCRPPPRQPKVLPIQQTMQVVAAKFRRSVIGTQRFCDRLRVVRTPQFLACGLRCQTHRVAFRRQVCKRTGDVLQRAAFSQQDGGVVARVDGKTIAEVVDEQTPVFRVEAELKLVFLEHTSVSLAQERRQHTAAQRGIRRIPVYVKELCVGAGAPPFQHVEPPGVVCTAHTHVVGHDVEDQPHAVRAQRCH